MHGTFEQLRAGHPGKWLLIRTDSPKSKTGALLFAHEDPYRVDEEMLRQPKDQDKERPLYVTWSVPEDGDLPAFAISPFPADL
jgi:hypothetical protein